MGCFFQSVLHWALDCFGQIVLILSLEYLEAGHLLEPGGRQPPYREKYGQRHLTWPVYPVPVHPSQTRQERLPLVHWCCRLLDLDKQRSDHYFLHHHDY